MLIAPASATTIKKEVAAVYQTAMREYTRTEKTSPGRVLSLRPSQMPFCPTNFFLENANHGLYRTLDFAGAYYTSVGTVVHSIMQEFLAKAGCFLADYHCAECDTWHKMSYKHECCGFPTRYEEISINYKGIHGHIDAVFRDAKGGLWILDYKTCSTVAAPKKQEDPGIVYIEQIETYAVLIELQYGIKIEGIMDAFIIRDNPRATPAIYSRGLTDEKRAEVKKRLGMYKRMHREALDAETWEDVLALAEYEKCVNPYCDACKMQDKDLVRNLRAAFDRGLAANRVPIRKFVENEIEKQKQAVQP
jgi:hypothetical protein